MNPVLCNLVINYHHMSLGRVNPLTESEIFHEEVGIYELKEEKEAVIARGSEAVTGWVKEHLFRYPSNTFTKGELKEQPGSQIKLSVKLILPDEVIEEVSLFEFRVKENGKWGISKITKVLYTERHSNANF